MLTGGLLVPLRDGIHVHAVKHKTAWTELPLKCGVRVKSVRSVYHSVFQEVCLPEVAVMRVPVGLRFGALSSGQQDDDDASLENRPGSLLILMEEDGSAMALRLPLADLFRDSTMSS